MAPMGCIPPVEKWGPSVFGHSIFCHRLQQAWHVILEVMQFFVRTGKPGFKR